MDLRFWVLVWLAAAVYLLFRHWRRGSGVGLMLSYVISFGGEYWLAAVFFLFPWYQNKGIELVSLGMRTSALALLAFTVGAELVTRVFVHRHREVAAPEGGHVDQVMVNAYLGAGLFMQIVLFPIARGLPTITALVGAGASIIVLGIGMKIWNSAGEGKMGRMWLWVLACLVLPLATVATLGFLGYGLAALLSVLALVGAILGPKPKVMVLGALLAYLGLSVYVTYMRDRQDIREVVWGGSSLSDRVDEVTGTLSRIEWFDPYNFDHLRRFEDRMNQNYLVGAAVAHMEAGRVAYAGGATLIDALWAMVPRALWPEKTQGAGSGDLVSRYTGIRFDTKVTAVGIGPVIEMYINFGLPGILIGFFVLGGLVSLLDRSAAAALQRGDAGHFALYYIPGLRLLLMEGSFVEVTSGAGAGFAVAFAINYIVKRYLNMRPKPLPGAPVASTSVTWR